MNKIIHTDHAPAAVGPYSQAVDCGDFVYCSGAIPLVPETGAIVEGGIEAQAHQMFKNCRAVLQAAGLDLGNVVKTTVFMTDLADFGKLNAIYGEYVTEPYPARSCVEVSALPKGVLVECECIAKK